MTKYTYSVAIFDGKIFKTQNEVYQSRDVAIMKARVSSWNQDDMRGVFTIETKADIPLVLYYRGIRLR